MTDSNNGLRILSIEDNPGDQCLITELLSASVIKIDLLRNADTLKKAIDLLQTELFDIILLNLSLPDSIGIGTFKEVNSVTGEIPIVILSGESDLNFGAEAITLGAQDYLIKTELDEKLLTKTILYSIERNRRLGNIEENKERYISVSETELGIMKSGEIARQIMNGALDAIVCTDAYGKIIVWNPQAENLFGWKEKEVLGRTLTESIIPTEYREKHENGMKHYMATGEGPILNKLVEVTAMNSAGQRFPVELTILPLKENGNRFFCAFIRDISEKRKIQEKENKFIEEQQILAELNKAVNRVQFPEEIYELTLDALQELVKVDKAAVLLFDNNNIMQFVACRNLSLKYKKEITGHSPWTADEKDARPIFISDVSKEPSLKEVLPIIKGEGISSLGFIPLIHQQQLLGKLMVYFNAVHQFSEEEIQLIQNVSSNVSFAIWEKRSNVALKESEEKYRSLIEQASDGIVVYSLDGTIYEFNQAAYLMSGYSREEFKKITLHNLLDNEEIVVNSSNVERVKNGETVLFERRVRKKDGTVIDIEQNVRMLADGKLFAFVRDVTGRKKMEEALLISELYLRGTLDSTNDGILAIDNNGKVITTNKRFGELWQIPDDLIVQKDDNKLLEYVLNQLADPVTFLSKVQELYQSDRIDFDVLKFKDEREYERYSTPLILNKNIVGRVWSFRDVTANKKAEATLKASEKNLRQVLSSTSDYYYVVDRNYRIVLINESAEKNISIAWGKPVTLSVNILDLIPKESDEPILKSLEKVFAGNKVEYELKVSVDGLPEWILVNYMPVYNDDGAIVGAYIVSKDISEKKKDEEQILITNARFQMLSKATSDIVWDWDMQDGSLWWNDNYYLQLGLKKEKELTDLDDWYSRIHPDDVHRVEKDIEAAYKDNSVFRSHEYRYRKADGTYLHFLDRSFVMRSSEGQPYRMIGSMINMTPVYEAQKEIVESENRLRTIINSDPQCIKLLDKDGVLLDMNSAGLAMIEADSIEQVKGRTVLNIVDEMYRKDFGRLIKNVFKNKSGTMLFSITGLKGTKRWLETNAVPMKSAEGSITALLGVTMDVTEKRNAEEELSRNEKKYRTLVEQAVDAIALYDASGKILDVNTGSVNLLGYNKQELMQMSLTDILTSEELQKRPVQYDVLQKGESTVKERKMKKKDGTIVETEVRSQQLPDGRFLSVIRDLSDRIRTEKDLAASYEAIRKLTGHLQDIREGERANIAREIHDELGQQLTVMKMDISWLKKRLKGSDEEVNEKLKDLLLMLDDTVKSVRRISSDLRPSLLDDLGLVAALEWQLKEFEKRSGIATNFVYAGNDMQLPDTIKTALFRIVQESLTNVARHSQAKKVIITITNDDDTLELSIVDNGRGFDKQKVTDKKTLGILGMKERVNILNGVYKINADPGKGTEVLVQIPMNKN